MKLLSVFLIFISLSASRALANDNCYERLTAGYSKDSNTFQIYNEEIAEEHEIGTLGFAKATIVEVLKDLKCAKSDIDALKVKSISGCSEVIPGNFYSRVCYVEHLYGYFHVTADMMDTYNVTFSRWD